jgi:hypothetical protein
MNFVVDRMDVSLFVATSWRDKTARTIAFRKVFD